MLFLSIIAISAVGLVFVNQFNKRLVDLKVELVKATQELKQKIEIIEKRMGGQPYVTQQSSIPVVPVQEPEPWELMEEKDSAPPVAPTRTEMPSTPPVVQKPNDDVRRFNNDDFRVTEVAYKPDVISEAFAKIKNYYMTGNTLVKVGVVLRLNNE